PRRSRSRARDTPRPWRRGRASDHARSLSGVGRRTLSMTGDRHMRVTIAVGTVACLGLFAAVTAGVSAPQSTSAPQSPSATAAAEATARIVAAAQKLVAALDEAGRTKVQFPFDGPQKAQWSNFPTGIYKRAGLRLG